MPNFGVTLFFDDGQESGFSETYYSPFGGYGAAASAAGTLITARLGIMVNLYRITGCRISDLDVFNDSYLPSLKFPQVGSLATLYGRPPPSLAANVRMEAGPFRRGRKYIRGIPVDMFSGESCLLPALNGAAWTAFVYALAVTWSLKTTVNPVTRSYDLNAITNVLMIGATRRRPGRPFGLLRGRRVRRR